MWAFTSDSISIQQSETTKNADFYHTLVMNVYLYVE